MRTQFWSTFSWTISTVWEGFGELLHFMINGFHWRNPERALHVIGIIKLSRTLEKYEYIWVEFRLFMLGKIIAFFCRVRNNPRKQYLFLAKSMQLWRWDIFTDMHWYVLHTRWYFLTCENSSFLSTLRQHFRTRKKTLFQKRFKFPHFQIYSWNDKNPKRYFQLSLLHIYAFIHDWWKENRHIFRNAETCLETSVPP